MQLDATSVRDRRLHVVGIRVSQRASQRLTGTGTFSIVVNQTAEAAPVSQNVCQIMHGNLKTCPP